MNTLIASVIYTYAGVALFVEWEKYRHCPVFYSYSFRPNVAADFVYYMKIGGIMNE